MPDIPEEAVERAAQALYDTFRDDEGYAAPVGVPEWKHMAQQALERSGALYLTEEEKRALRSVLAEHHEFCQPDDCASASARQKLEESLEGR